MFITTSQGKLCEAISSHSHSTNHPHLITDLILFTDFTVLILSCFLMSYQRLFIYLFGVLRSFQHSTGHITTGSWKGRGNQYIQLVRVLYCKLPTNGKQLPAFPLEAVPGTEPRPQRWEARVLPLCHRGPPYQR